MSNNVDHGCEKVNSGQNPASKSPRSRSGDGLLVYKSIFQNTVEGEIQGYTIYKNAVGVLKSSNPFEVIPRGESRGVIDSFSYKSRKRLKFLCSNSNQELISQFCCTYHKKPPVDGKELKKHLNNFLTRIRKQFSDVSYIWVMEFQTNSRNPHFHLFLSIPVCRDYQRFLAETWNTITKETEQHLKVHLHSKNFIGWNMGSGSYLTSKYLEKEAQKKVPENFKNSGRFWGATRCLVEAIGQITTKRIREKFTTLFDPETKEVLDSSMPLKYIYRVLRKHHESKVNFHRKYKKKYGQWVRREEKRFKKFKSQITRKTSCVLPSGGLIFYDILDYLKREYQPVPF